MQITVMSLHFGPYFERLKANSSKFEIDFQPFYPHKRIILSSIFTSTIHDSTVSLVVIQLEIAKSSQFSLNKLLRWCPSIFFQFFFLAKI